MYFISSYFLFLLVLGLRCCTSVFSSCSKQGLFLIVLGLLTAVASLVADCRLQGSGLQQLQHVALECRLSSCDPWAQLLHSMWNLPRPGIKPMFPALAGRFLSTVPPGKSPNHYLVIKLSLSKSKKFDSTNTNWKKLCIIIYCSSG